MSDSELIINEELFVQNNTATLFHRTNATDNISNVLKQGWGTKGGVMYGRGIYTTYILADQFRQYMGRYGNVLVKFKYTGLDKLLFFSPELAKKIYGDKYLLIDQINKLVPDHGLNESNIAEINRFQSIAENATYSSEAAKKFVDSDFFDNLHAKLNGIEYYGSNDGHCIVIYPPGKGIELISYVKYAPDNVDAIKDLEWIQTGAKKTFTKAFTQGIFVKPDIELPIPAKPTEKIPFMHFIKNMKDKNEVDVDDVEELFKYSFSSNAFMNIFEKLNPALLKTTAFTAFIHKFEETKNKQAEFKVFKAAAKHKPTVIFSHLLYKIDDYEESWKTEIVNLLFDVDLNRLGESGKLQLGKTFGLILSKIKNATEYEPLRNKIIDFIIKNNFYNWFINVQYNETMLLFQHLFKKAEDIINFIAKAKQNGNFNLNETVAYIAAWLRNQFTDTYTDEDLMSIMESLKDLPAAGKYFNAENQGPLAVKIGKMYLMKYPERITSQILPVIISILEEKDIDELNKINPELFRTSSRHMMSEALEAFIQKNKSKTPAAVEKIWKYMILTPVDQEDYIGILNAINTDSAIRNVTETWITLLKKITRTFILSGKDVSRIYGAVHNPTEEIVTILLSEITNPAQFDEDIFYSIIGAVNGSGENIKAIIMKWFHTVEQAFPSYIRKIISNPTFAGTSLPDNRYDSVDLIAYLYLKFYPEGLPNLKASQLTLLLNRTWRIDLKLELTKLYAANDNILKRANDPTDESENGTLQPLLFSESARLGEDEMAAIVEKINNANPNFFKEVHGYYIDKFFEYSRNKKFALGILIKYKGENLTNKDITTIFDLFHFNQEVPTRDLINLILETKKDKLDANSIHTIVTNAINIDMPPTAIINLLNTYNPKYISDINHSSWGYMIQNAADDKTGAESQYIEDLLFNLPLSASTNNKNVKRELIRTNKLKAVKRLLDSNKFTLESEVLREMLPYVARDVAVAKQLSEHYKIESMTGAELAELYNNIGGEYFSSNSTNKNTALLKNNEGLKLFFNKIGNRLNAAGETEQMRFLNESVQKTSTLFNSSSRLIVMRVDSITKKVFSLMLFEAISYGAYYVSQSVSSLLKLILKYNNRGWNLENFFDAVKDPNFQMRYGRETSEPLSLSSLIKLVMNSEGKNIKARSLQVILNNTDNVDERKKIIDTVIHPENKGAKLNSNDVSVITTALSVIKDDNYVAKTILTILKLVNQNITNAMVVNLLQVTPQQISNHIGTEYVAHLIMLYRKNTLDESAIYNLIRLQSSDESKLKVIDKILSIKTNTLAPKDIYNILTLVPVAGLKSVVNTLMKFYDNEYIKRILKSRGLDPDTILQELKNYKTYYFSKI